MKLISSKDNALYKEFKALATSHSARKKANKTILDGVHLTQAYLDHGLQPLYCLFSEEMMVHAEVATLIDRCEALHIPCICLSNELFAAVSQVEHGIDISFIIDVPSVDVPQSLTSSAVLLDQIQDPGNMGSILRSAATAGIEYVYCAKGSAAAWSPKVLRAGMGAHFVVKIIENADLFYVIEHSKIPVYATSSYATNSLYDLDLTEPVAWLMGHEGQGVSAHLMDVVSDQIIIPQLGKMESLNVAAAAAVCFFEQVRQRTQK